MMPGRLARLRALVRRHALFLVGLGLAFTFVRWPSLTGWDESFYLAQMTSALADRDLVLHDDLLRLGEPLDSKLRMLTTTSDSGALLNTFSVGPALLNATYAWPVLVRHERPTPFTLRATLAVGALATLVLTVLALIALVEKAGFPPGVARVSAVVAVAGGPLALYGTRMPLNSHLPSALGATLVFLAVLVWLETPLLRHAVAFGLAAGFLVVTRWQDIVLVLALAPAVVAAARRSPGPRVQRLLAFGLAAVACALVVAVQLAAWRAQFDRPLLIPQGSGYMRWTDPAIVPVLLSTYHGLIPWAPGLALGVAAVLFLRLPPRARTERAFIWGLRVAALAVLYVSACPRDWWGGEAFGPRRLVSLTPLAALGLAAVLTRMRRPSLRAALVAALSLWALFVTTAQLSGYDDLSVVLFNTTSHSNPRDLASYAGAQWIDRMPTWPLLLRPGFKLSDHPRPVERVVGLLVVLLVVPIVTLVWNAVRRSPRLQRLVLAGAFGWAAVAVVWVAALPTNVRWNAGWRSVVRDADGCKTLSTLPRGMEEAGHVVCAARAVRVGDRASLGRHLAALKHAEDYWVDERTLAAAAERRDATPSF